jgi:hypothetical protein
MQLKHLVRVLVSGLFFLFIVGCAKKNIQNTYEIANTGIPKPNLVLVYSFAVNPQNIKQNSSIFSKIQRNIENKDQTSEEIQLGREVSDALATELALKTAGLGLNSVRADENFRVAPGTVLITGNFVGIDEGNQLSRNAIGLGVGKSSLDSKVQVFVSSASGNQELIAFDVHTDSGNMPGAAVTGPAGAVAGAGTAVMVGSNVAMSGVKSYKSSSARLAKQMAEDITAQLAKYFAQQGWINPELAK